MPKTGAFTMHEALKKAMLEPLEGFMNEGGLSDMDDKTQANEDESAANQPVNLTARVERVVSTPIIPVIDLTSE